MAKDWHSIDTRLAKDWLRIGNGLATDWHSIGEGLVPDWHSIDDGSVEVADLKLATVGNGLAMDWRWIGTRLVLDWPQIIKEADERKQQQQKTRAITEEEIEDLFEDEDACIIAYGQTGNIV